MPRRKAKTQPSANMPKTINSVKSPSYKHKELQNILWLACIIAHLRYNISVE